MRRGREGGGGRGRKDVQLGLGATGLTEGQSLFLEKQIYWRQIGQGVVRRVWTTKCKQEFLVPSVHCKSSS